MNMRFITHWKCMIGRISSRNSVVCDEWLDYKKFADWAESHYFPNAHLDKDILGNNSRVYSPKTCAFVSKELNLFYKDGEWLTRNLPRRIRLNGHLRFQAKIGRTVIGTYLTKKSAIAARKKFILDKLMDFATTEPDDRVCAALRSLVERLL